MKQVISVKDLQEMVRNGNNFKSIPTDALLTPSARDFLRDHEDNSGPRVQSSPAATAAAAPAQPAKPVSANSPKADIEAFFNSPKIAELKEQICDVGRRLWQRACGR
jgi:hypothetical protein